MFVSVAFFFVVRNQSDALFSSLSAIALAQLLSFQESRKLRDIWIGSAALGPAALARVDALAWIADFTSISIVIGFRTCSIGRITLVAIVPAVGFVAGFVAISRIDTGSFDDSIGSLAPKLYQAFEQNQSVLTGGNDEAAYRQARKLFGTPDDNQGSVFRAILKNPSAFWLRIVTNSKNLPNLYLSAFDKRVGPMLLIFAGLGIVALIRRGAYEMLVISLIWALPSAYYFGFLSRHVVATLTYLPIVFASIGFTYAFRRDLPRSELTAYILAGLLLIGYSWIDDKLAFLAAGLVLTLLLVVIWLLWSRRT